MELRKDNPELVPDVDLAQPPADAEQPKHQKKRQSEPIGMDVVAAKVEDADEVDNQNANADGTNLDLNDSDVGSCQ